MSTLTTKKRIVLGVLGAAVIGGCIAGAVYFFNKHRKINKSVFPCGSPVEYTFDYAIPEINKSDKAVPITIYGYSLGADWDSDIAKADKTANDTHFYIQWTAFNSDKVRWTLKEGYSAKYFGSVALNSNATPNPSVFEPKKVTVGVCPDITKSTTIKDVMDKLTPDPISPGRAVPHATLINPTLFNPKLTSGIRWPSCSMPGSMLKPTKEANLGQDIPTCPSPSIPSPIKKEDPCLTARYHN